MHLTLIVVGKLKTSTLKSLYEDYEKRLDWKLTLHEIAPQKTSLKEGSLLLEKCSPTSALIPLDEKGDLLSSEEFSTLLENIQLHHQGKATFIIGGSHGLSPEIKARASRTLSLGRMTWPHLFARVLLVEQLYRAQQILKGHPYHHG